MSIKKFLNDIEMYLASAVFAVMLFIILLQVFTRAIGHPLSWAEELARYLMIWGVSLGVAAGTKRRSHVSIDSIVDHLPFKISASVRILMDVLVVLVFGYIAFFGGKFTYMAIASGQLMPAIQKPVWLVYLALPVGFGCATIRQIICTVHAIKDPKGRCGIQDESTAKIEKEVEA